ncbi:hypothetical protein F0U61_35255 [Archangium violaceum]|uniref:hypothetical protein n=1 Tax=Archangium violaceum TaxID=83451 RepID=UPI002B2FD420|nr:hypothetical protein F0U61_35255 [Archangium violaceum]
MRALCVVLLLLSSAALAAEGITVKVRCVGTCTVLLEGKPGRRLHDSLWNWEFTHVSPGKRRLEVKGFLGGSQATGYIDIPDVSEVHVHVDSKGRLSVSPAADASTRPAPPKERKKEEDSVLHVRCQRPCTVSVDHVRRPSADSRTVIVHGLKPGAHRVEVGFALGGGDRRDFIELPPSSEVFVFATDAGLHVTNTRPLGK